MKRQACLLSLIVAALAAPPGVLAGSDIVKCVDQAGHLTLTDQPCTAGAATVRLSTEPAAESAAPSAMADVEAPPLSVEHLPRRQPMLRPGGWKTPAAGPAKPLARDVATLKAARVQLLLMDSVGRPPRLRG
jgi:hypothetical protein